MSLVDLPRSAGDALEPGLRSDPDREVVVASDRRLTYAELDAAVEVAASTLHQQGVVRGDRVAVRMTNVSDIVVVFYAAMRLGAVWVGINTNLAPPEMHHILKDSGSRLLIANDEFLGTVDSEVQRDLGFGCLPVHEIAHSDGNGDYPRPVDLFDVPAGIAYTSGTTGRPKGVVHTHRNLLLPGAVLVADRGYDEHLRRGDCASLTILNLQVTSTLLTAQAGGTQIVMDRVDPEGIAAWIAREQVNSWFGVPTMLLGLARHADVHPSYLASLEDVWTGGADLPESIRVEFESKFQRRVHATYGLTEVPTVVSIEERGSEHIPGSSGRILPHLQVHADRNPDPTSEESEIEEGGELVVSGATEGEWAGAYTPMAGYYGNPRLSEGSLREGMLRTGDVGWVDSGSNVFIRGRRSSMILRGGSNVYPAEVERVILRVPDVQGVAVVGYTDERLGQRVGAALEIVPGSQITEADLLEHCRASLARYKVPDRWTFRTLPRNAMGKVAHKEVSAWFSEDAGG